MSRHRQHRKDNGRMLSHVISGIEDLEERIMNQDCVSAMVMARECLKSLQELEQRASFQSIRNECD
ncbi:MAG: hypothetical protein KTR14_00280 [Vampirovibrio sp.]|nr:hypothetical protein [Vampirovibrio sp.]